MLQPGDRIGRFEIQRRLGRGGMATVYVAHDPNLGRLVALKMFEGDLDTDDAPQKFLREARAAAALNHPHIVTIHDFGEFASQPYIVMEYLQGDTLAALIKRKEPLHLSERLRLLEEICSGVAYAHGFDVIHRDIKPANLFRDRTGRLKVLDFGIARTMSSSMSRGTALVGTPGYMAPEQIHGGEIDRRADLFAIGVVAYELLSYAEAFSGDSLPAISHRVLHDEPVSLATLNPEIPTELVAVVEKALKKNPDERFADAATMGAALTQARRQLPGDPSEAPTVVVPRRPPSERGSGPGSGGGRGSGGTRDSARPSDAPTPNVARTGREEIQRRRAAEIDASLGRAGVLLDQGRAAEALDACMHALALDENHSGALDLEHRIRVALDQQKAVQLVTEGRSALDHGELTLAQRKLESARALYADAAEVKQLERDLRLARADQQEARQRAEAVRRLLESAEADLQRNELESALAFARQAVRLDAASDTARELEAEARRRLDLAAGVPATTHSQSPRPVAPVSPKPAGPSAPGLQKRPGPSPVEQVIRRTAAASSGAWTAISRHGRTGWSALNGYARQAAALATARRPAAPTEGASTTTVKKTAQRPRWLPWALGGGLAVAALIVAVVMWPRQAPVAPPVKTGTVTIDATPWATVTAIVASDGSSHVLPPDSVTPLSLELPPGTYRVTLTGPPPDCKSEEVRVTVEEGRTSTSSELRFTPLTAEAYFEPYLAAPVEAVVAEPAAASARPAGSEAR
jgi:tetratricopeptide (TPR) repeat protein